MNISDNQFYRAFRLSWRDFHFTEDWFQQKNHFLFVNGKTPSAGINRLYTANSVFDESIVTWRMSRFWGGGTSLKEEPRSRGPITAIRESQVTICPQTAGWRSPPDLWITATGYSRDSSQRIIREDLRMKLERSMNCILLPCPWKVHRGGLLRKRGLYLNLERYPHSQLILICITSMTVRSVALVDKLNFYELLISYNNCGTISQKKEAGRHWFLL